MAAQFVVADSGVFICAVLKEALSDQVDGLIKQWSEQNLQIMAPTLWRSEVVAVVRKNVYRGLLDADDAAVRLENLLTLGQLIQFVMDDDLLRRAFELATQFNRPTAYDTQYVALAERLGCEFWTCDERLVNTLSITLNWVKWIGNFQVP